MDVGSGCWGSSLDFVCGTRADSRVESGHSSGHLNKED